MVNKHQHARLRVDVALAMRAADASTRQIAETIALLECAEREAAPSNAAGYAQDNAQVPELFLGSVFPKNNDDKIIILANHLKTKSGPR